MRMLLQGVYPVKQWHDELVEWTTGLPIHKGQILGEGSKRPKCTVLLSVHESVKGTLRVSVRSAPSC